MVLVLLEIILILVEGDIFDVSFYIIIMILVIIGVVCVVDFYYIFLINLFIFYV